MKKSPVLLLASLLALGVVVAGILSNATINGGSSQKEADFGIYLVAEDIPFNQVASFDIYSVELQNEPFISIDNIVSYSKDTHEIMLTDESSDRISSLRSSVFGIPFVVCVGSERIYSGVFYTPWIVSSKYVPDVGVITITPTSTAEIEVITIDPAVASTSHSIQISAASLYRLEDPRSDSRILESLEHAGKLVN